jgi:hypothetical protein
MNAREWIQDLPSVVGSAQFEGRMTGSAAGLSSSSAFVQRF